MVQKIPAHVELYIISMQVTKSSILQSLYSLPKSYICKNMGHNSTLHLDTQSVEDFFLY